MARVVKWLNDLQPMTRRRERLDWLQFMNPVSPDHSLNIHSQFLVLSTSRTLAIQRLIGHPLMARLHSG